LIKRKKELEELEVQEKDKSKGKRKRGNEAEEESPKRAKKVCSYNKLTYDKEKPTPAVKISDLKCHEVVL